MTIVVNEIGIPLRHKFSYKCTMGGRRDIIETKFEASGMIVGK